MATTNNNKNPLIDGEPLPKRMRFNDEKINIDLKKLMSQYNSGRFKYIKYCYYLLN